MKRSRKIFFLILAILIICLGLFFLISHEVFSSFNTEYTKDFSYSKLNSIKTGMTEQQVLEIIGRPFSEHSDDYSCSSYSRAKSDLSDYTGWESVRICYDNNNNVTGVGDNVFFD